MGKYALLISFGCVLTVALLGQHSQRTNRDASEDQSERQGTVIARQIARSAFSNGVSEVKREFNNISDGTKTGSYEQGDYQIEYTTSTNGDGDKRVTIVAKGTFRDTTYQIRGKAVRDTSISALYNAITANTPISFNVAGGGCSGGPCISGIDAGEQVNRHGISLPPDTDPGAICDEFQDDGTGDQIEGSGEGCDVTQRSTDWNNWVTQQMEKTESQIQNAIDSGDENVTVCDGCRLKDLSTDSGILYVTGELTIGGSDQWNGLVYTGEGGSVRINGGGSAKNINGGLMMSDSTGYDQDDNIDLNGGNSIKFNSEQLMKYVNTVPTISTTYVTITDRNGRFVRRNQ